MPAPLSLKQQVAELLQNAVSLISPAYGEAVELERPKQTQHGDFATSVALKLAKAAKQNPRALAEAIVRALPASPLLARVEVAGAGFINVQLRSAAWAGGVRQILAEGEAYGRSTLGQDAKVQVEFVSANPTGPLHVGHGRGAAYGASLANVLHAAGYQVTREYYVNDAGRQMDILALSTWLRYLEENDVRVPFPSNAYQGDYVRAMARSIFRAHGSRYVHKADDVMDGIPPRPDRTLLENGDPAAKAANEAHLDALIAASKRLLGVDYPYFHDFALNDQLSDCRADLEEFGVAFDHWFSEKSLFDLGLVEDAVARLQTHGHLYEQDGALWFRSSALGDEKDRVVRRANGEYTYFASDIAYHAHKYERGFARMIDVWGADHHGYIPRVKAALTALGLDAERLSVALVQFAVLYRGGQKVSMSTRAGDFVTLRELREEVGNDAARFYYVLRKSDQHLDFDLDLAKSQSNDNPVYYIQYAHARICSVLNEWGGNPAELLGRDLASLTGSHETALMRRLAEYPEAVTVAARELSPHLIAYYLRDLAGELHTYYNAEKFLVDDQALRDARLALITAVRQVLANGLGLLGVSAPTRM